MTNSYPLVVAPQQPRKLPLGKIKNLDVPLQSAVTTAADHLSQHGYVILEQVLSPAMVLQLRQTLDELLKQERLTPYEPGDGSAQPGDDELAEYLSDSYSPSPDELQRIMRRIRYTRAQNQDTPWPVGPKKINKTFMHIPNLFDHDRSQYVRNLPAKTELSDQLVENPLILGIARHLLGDDCVLGDITATSIGPGTDGGAWHLDNPLTQMAEPLPDFPLGLQVAWMIDDFKPENGATRVVAKSHLTRRKPDWKRGSGSNELALSGTSGSVAIWLASTWHRAGPNSTDQPRRAIISFYQCSWIKPFSEYRWSIDPKRIAQMSATAKYLYGFSANGLRRG